MPRFGAALDERLRTTGTTVGGKAGHRGEGEWWGGGGSSPTLAKTEGGGENPPLSSHLDASGCKRGPSFLTPRSRIVERGTQDLCWPALVEAGERLPLRSATGTGDPFTELVRCPQGPRSRKGGGGDGVLPFFLSYVH